MPFIANLEPKEGFPLNVVTLEVQVLEEQGDELIVLTSEGVKAGVKRQFVWDSELEARIGARRGRYVYLRQKIGRANKRRPSERAASPCNANTANVQSVANGRTKPHIRRARQHVS